MIIGLSGVQFRLWLTIDNKICMITEYDYRHELDDTNFYYQFI